MTTSFRSLASRTCLVVVATFTAGCEDPGEPFVGGGSPCGVVNPPLQLGDDDRVLSDVMLEVQIKGIVMKVVVDDPDGTAEFASVTQQIDVFQDPACRTATLSARNQITAVGTPVTFGTVVRLEYYPDLYQQIAASAAWPVRLHFVDNEGQEIEARVRARVVERRDEY
ncbi:MAG TPA: hypothetical protein VF039_11480 [Longimicrobiales bacterium]